MTNPGPDLQKYCYSPLLQNQIRIVKILPGNDFPIAVKIEIVSLTTVPFYDALSYCWGDSIERVECRVEGGTVQSVLYVTQTLHQALKQIRHDSDEIPIWIDQLCIDQQNKPERIHQVRLMKEIYKSAHQVVVWLGEADNETGLVFSLINDVWDQVVKQVRAHGVEKTVYNPTDPYSAHCALDLTSADTQEWVAFRKFLVRPWFVRIWTVQELVLSKRNIIVCGSYETSWQRLHYVCHCLGQADNQIEDNRSHLKDTDKDISFLGICWLYKNEPAEDIRREIEPNLKLTNLLHQMMLRCTSEPQDKIYGILGLAVDVDIQTYPVDYTRHFRYTYSYVTKYIINQYSDLEILRRTEIQPFNETSHFGPRNCPSWTPDYRFNRISKFSLWSSRGPKLAQHGRLRLYNATGLSKASVEINDSVELGLYGIRLGTIKGISHSDGCNLGDVTIGPNVLIDGQWANMAVSSCLSDGIYSPTNEPVHLAYARLRIRDYLPGERTRADRNNRTQPLLSIPEPGVSTFLRNSSGEKLLHYESSDKITPVIMHSCKCSRLALLDNRYMGLVHQSCTINDEIWLLMGGDMPFVVRPLVTGRYEYKGEAYIHGAMEGEYLIKNYKVPTDSRDDQVWLDSLAEEIPFKTTQIVLI